MKLIVTITTLLLFLNSSGQKTIQYKFDKEVEDTLKSQISQYQKLFNKTIDKLKLYIMFNEETDGYIICLAEYSYLPKSGFLDLINKTNRIVKINGKSIPILFHADILSTQLKKDNIAYIPNSGFYTQIKIENYKQKVISTRVLF